MFNPDNYGEEEFGPDDPKAKVKKTRKKKKVTKAIVVFGGADEAAEAKKSVKASHNLQVGKIYFFLDLGCRKVTVSPLFVD